MCFSPHEVFPCKAVVNNANGGWSVVPSRMRRQLLIIAVKDPEKQDTRGHKPEKQDTRGHKQVTIHSLEDCDSDVPVVYCAADSDEGAAAAPYGHRPPKSCCTVQ